jgi:hypothetical protein
MRAVGHKRGKKGHYIEEDVGNTLDDGVRFLALIESVPQARVDPNDILNVPEYLLDEVRTALLRYGVLCTERAHPHLRISLAPA